MSLYGKIVKLGDYENKFKAYLTRIKKKGLRSYPTK